MTPKQMYRAMRKWGISLVSFNDKWYAGNTRAIGPLGSAIECLVVVRHSDSIHVGPTPESAIEDYCNARDLEWDV